MTALVLHELSIAEAGAGLRSGLFTARQLVEHALARIEALDRDINSVITVTSDLALAAADAADADFAAGLDRGPMQGIPYAIKDIFMTQGIRTTCQSRLRIDYVPEEDCFVAQRLKAGGAVMIGKTAAHEFACGGPSLDSPFPPARNPWCLEHGPGGSSSGSGAAVAAGFVRAAIGSDSGGSIRGPAGYCGIVGLKPTSGLVSCRGVFPLSFSLDHVGPLAWSVEDAALVMQVIEGFDTLDPKSVDAGPIDFVSDLRSGVKGLRLAVPKSFYECADGIDPQTIEGIDRAIGIFRNLGASVEFVTLPDYRLFSAAGWTILYAEAFAIHERDMKSQPQAYSRQTHARFFMGGLLSASDFVQAQRVRARLRAALDENIFTDFDAIVTASTLTPAHRLDFSDTRVPTVPPVQTMPFNLTGHPAMSVPTGFSSDGLPLSMQIVGRAFDDATVLKIGFAFENAEGAPHRRYPC